jgi:hypothetical protein
MASKRYYTLPKTSQGMSYLEQATLRKKEQSCMFNEISGMAIPCSKLNVVVSA